MRLIECPHCHATVLPKALGECPACRRDTRNTAGADLNLCAVDIAEHERLPDVCIGCGLHTDRTVKVRRSRATDDTPFLLRAVVFVLHPMHFLMSRGGVRHTVELRLPMCPGCAAAGKIEPKSVGFDDYRMELIVHREFRRRLKALRDRAG